VSQITTTFKISQQIAFKVPLKVEVKARQPKRKGDKEENDAANGRLQDRMHEQEALRDVLSWTDLLHGDREKGEKATEERQEKEEQVVLLIIEKKKGR
jgi:hypothetical protein